MNVHKSACEKKSIRWCSARPMSYCVCGEETHRQIGGGDVHVCEQCNHKFLLEQGKS